MERDVWHVHESERFSDVWFRWWKGRIDVDYHVSVAVV